MGDITGDYQVAQQRVRVAISTQKTNLERYKLELMELEARRRQTEVNKSASEMEVKKLGEQLEGLIKEHGESKSTLEEVSDDESQEN